MSKILSIEVGYSLTRICEIDYQVKNPKIYNYFSVTTPQGAVEDGFLTGNVELSRNIRDALALNKIKTKQVVFTVTSSKIATREYTVPMVKKQQLDALVRTNAYDYFPVDLNNYEFAYLVQGTTESEPPMYRIQAMIAEKELVAGYMNLARECGLTLISMDYSGNSIFQLMRSECNEDETEMVVKVEERFTAVAIISNHELVLQRSVMYGVMDCVSAVQTNPIFHVETYQEALELMMHKTCIRNVVNELTKILESETEEDNEKIKAAKTEVTYTLGPLLSNIGKVIDLYNRQHPDAKPVKKVRLVGVGSDISGLSRLITNELGIKCTGVNDLKSLTWPKLEGRGTPGRYVACIGASINPVGFINDEEGKAKLESRKYKNISVLMVLLTLVVCAALAIIGFMDLTDATAEQTKLKAQEIKYAPAEDVYNQMLATEAFYGKILEGEHLTNHPNDKMIAFLTELEQKLPADAEVSQISSNKDQVALVMYVSTMEEAAKVIDTMRGFESLINVTTGEIVIETIEKEENNEAVIADKDASEDITAEEPAIDENGEAIPEGEEEEEQLSRVRLVVTGTYYSGGSVVTENATAPVVEDTMDNID